MIPGALVPHKGLVLAGAAVALALSGFGAGWVAQGWRLGKELAEVRAKQSGKVAEDATEALGGFQRAVGVLAGAASAAQTGDAQTARELRALRQEMRNAKPLPPGCVPDADRLRHRNAAIEAYNRAAIGRDAGGAVPEH